MTALRAAVEAAFAEAGPLARVLNGYRPREGQHRLAVAVAEVIEQGGQLVAEAATGVGKTFAYLVPALLSGERVLLSTATKTLQDQLFARDLPRLTEVLGLPVRMALLKGRASYVCLHRLGVARQSGAVTEPADRAALAQVERWAQVTRMGDLAELPDLDERSPVIPLVTSTRENCLGTGCPQFRRCHVNHARREALAADLVVINHHLFFADLSIRESGMAELLPSVRVVVFDEAHQLNETGIQFLGRHLGSGQLLDFARDMLACGLQHARGLADWHTLCGEVEMAARQLRLSAGAARTARRLSWTDRCPDGVETLGWTDSLHRLRSALQASHDALALLSELSPDFARLHERADHLAGLGARFAEPGETGQVRWVDVGSSLRLTESPLDIAEAMRTRVFAAPAEEGRPRAWVFVSATLGDDRDLRWFTEPCGLDETEVLRIGSPFDYARQSALYVPPHVVPPSDPMHATQVALLAASAAERLHGRTMVLTTTLRALQRIGGVLRERFGEASDIEVLVQGTLPKRVLMDRFRQHGAAGQPGRVLVASASFWEGVDLPGDALQCLVIDKLPFPPPDDPLVEARSRRLEGEGRSAFSQLSLPEAAVALKQGAGRLIRRESDRGVLVICDRRLVTMGYGKRLLKALPSMQRLEDARAFELALEALASGEPSMPTVDVQE